jgi:hypothetical protein
MVGWGLAALGLVTGCAVRHHLALASAQQLATCMHVINVMHACSDACIAAARDGCITLHYIIVRYS